MLHNPYLLLGGDDPDNLRAELQGSAASAAVLDHSRQPGMLQQPHQLEQQLPLPSFEHRLETVASIGGQVLHELPGFGGVAADADLELLHAEPSSSSEDEDAEDSAARRRHWGLSADYDGGGGEDCSSPWTSEEEEEDGGL